MTTPLNHFPLPESVRLLAAFLTELSSQVDVAASLEERLSHLELAFLQLVEKLGILPAVQAQAARAGKVGKQARAVRKKMQESAAEGISALKLVAQGGGAALMQLDGRSCIRLSPELAALLIVLTATGGNSPDHLVPWRSRESVEEALQLKTGKRLNKKALGQLIYRFREVLSAHDENRFYVMSDRDRGYRFALRRTPSVFTQQGTGRLGQS